MRARSRMILRPAVVVAFGLCLVVLIPSCRLPLTKILKPAEHALLAGRSLLRNPFRKIDHVQYSRINAARTLAAHRVRPATTVVGKRFFALSDCRSVALRNNLDLQVARVEELTKRSLELSKQTKMLPHFTFSGELNERDNMQFSYSDPMGQEGVAPEPTAGGDGVSNWSSGNERAVWRLVLEAKWSPTDAALAYYVSQSGANDRLKAHYQKVRVAQKMIGLVDSAYFKLLSLQHAVPLAERLVAIRSNTAKKSRLLVMRKLRGVKAYRKAKKDLIRAERLLSKLSTEMAEQRNILASAMALSPDYCVDGGFHVVGELSRPYFDARICDMELIAVKNRPEAYEAGLNSLSSANDLKRTIVKYFPKVTGFWKLTRDKNKYILNKEWKEVGMLIHFDLLDWLSNLHESRAARSTVTKTERAMGTIALGIASQVRFAALKYFNAMDGLKSAENSLPAYRDVMRVAEEQYSKESIDKLAVEEARGDLIAEKTEVARAIGKANATLAELQAAMGTNYTEPPPAD